MENNYFPAVTSHSFVFAGFPPLAGRKMSRRRERRIQLGRNPGEIRRFPCKCRDTQIVVLTPTRSVLTNSFLYWSRQQFLKVTAGRRREKPEEGKKLYLCDPGERLRQCFGALLAAEIQLHMRSRPLHAYFSYYTVLIAISASERQIITILLSQPAFLYPHYWPLIYYYGEKVFCGLPVPEDVGSPKPKAFKCFFLHII